MYESLNPTFFIGILDFEITKNPGYLSRHKILDLETGENVVSDIEFNFIELPKFNKAEGELKTVIDQWIYFLKNAENLAVIPETVHDQGLQSAYEDAAKHNWTQAELDAYDYVFMREQDDRGRMSFAVNKAVRLANEAAAIQAQQAAEAAAIQAQKAAKEQQETIARNLLQAGVAAEVVAQSTGLTVEELKKL